MSRPPALCSLVAWVPPSWLAELPAWAQDWRWAWAAAGLALALFGRRLYFCFLSCVGFAYGWVLAQLFGADGWWFWALVLGLGLLGALLSRSAERVALALAGAILGSLFAAWLLVVYGPLWGSWTALLFVGCAVLGAFLFFRVYRVGLVLGSALFGAIVFVGFASPALAEHADLVLPVPWRWPLVLGFAAFAAYLQFRGPDAAKGRERRLRKKIRREISRTQRAG